MEQAKLEIALLWTYLDVQGTITTFMAISRSTCPGTSVAFMTSTMTGDPFSHSEGWTGRSAVAVDGIDRAVAHRHLDPSAIPALCSSRARDSCVCGGVCR